MVVKVDTGLSLLEPPSWWHPPARTYGFEPRASQTVDRGLVDAPDRLL